MEINRELEPMQREDLRKRKVPDILNSSDRISTDCDVREGRVVERLVAEPVHCQDRRMSTEPVTARYTRCQHIVSCNHQDHILYICVACLHQESVY